jgi:hypothetical protein
VTNAFSPAFRAFRIVRGYSLLLDFIRNRSFSALSQLKQITMTAIEVMVAKTMATWLFSRKRLVVAWTD